MEKKEQSIKVTGRVIQQKEVAVTSNVIPQPTNEQAKERVLFTRLLVKCQAIDQHRHRKFRADIHQFVLQAVKDSVYLIEGKYPPDVLQLAQKKRRSKG
jgi:hypothetical protein